jgi:transcriptional regulator of acetoin/glycerol metabolism
VTAGRFREDLYFRVGRPEVTIPRLKDRIDEIPVHVARELQAVDPELFASTAFVEACALRAWPGNVRELHREVRGAAHRAVAESVTLVDDRHLAREAGVPFSRKGNEPESEEPAAPRLPPTDEAIERALVDNDGNVRGTARALGMHRNQLRRWLEKRGRAVPKDRGSTVPPDPEQDDED